MTMTIQKKAKDQIRNFFNNYSIITTVITIAITIVFASLSTTKPQTLTILSRNAYKYLDNASPVAADLEMSSSACASPFPADFGHCSGNTGNPSSSDRSSFESSGSVSKFRSSSSSFGILMAGATGAPFESEFPSSAVFPFRFVFLESKAEMEGICSMSLLVCLIPRKIIKTSD